MTDFDKLSDEALRTKLLEHGFPVMPITGTTRKIMIKKLKLLQENRKKANALERRTMAKYSSDDDSELEKKPKGRRATVAPIMTAKPKVQSQTNGNHSGGAGRSAAGKKNRLMVQVQHFSSDTSSDTEPELPEVYSTPRQVHLELEDAGEEEDEDDSLGLNLNNSYSNQSSNNSGSPPKRFTMEPRRHTPSVQRPQPLKSAYTAFRTPLALGEQATSTPGEEQANHLRARRCLASTALDDEEDLGLLEQTPYLKNFSKRLSLLTAKESERRHPLRHDASRPNIFIRTKQKLMMFFRTESKRRMSTNTNCRNTSGAALKSEENTGNLISLALVAAVAMFFVILVALYYGLHRGSNTNDIIGLKVPYCSHTVTRDCLSHDEAVGGIDLYKIFKPMLIELAIDYQCGYLVAPPVQSVKKTFYMTDADIVRFVKENYKIQDERAIRQDIDSFVLIAHHNRFLGVSVLRVDPKSQSDDYLLIDDIKEANELLENGVYTRAFAVLSPSLPWRCSFWQKITSLLKATFIILSLAGALFLGKFAYKWLKYYQHKRKEEVVMLVEKILEMLQTQPGDDQFLVINHVRDMIIPIGSRKKMDGVWQRALKFIDENESRVRTEVQVVKGESNEVWRWIGAQNVSLNCSAASPAGKLWQGQAFDVQTPPCSPTPCLKIRGMIDDADRGCNKAGIRDAILGKCAQCRVLHVAADINTKCVYLKCADTNDAAIAYRCLHGNWYAGHIVTVKYLRLERYMQRFPDSPVSGPPFLKI